MFPNDHTVRKWFEKQIWPDSGSAPWRFCAWEAPGQQGLDPASFVAVQLVAVFWRDGPPLVLTWRFQPASWSWSSASTGDLQGVAYMPRPFNGRQIFSLGRAGCTHVSDLLVRENCPLALMESVPVRPGNFVGLHRESCSTSGFHASRGALPAITANVFATRVCRTSVRRKGGSLGSLPSVHGFLHSAGLVRGRHRPDSPKPKPGEMSHGWPSLAGLYRQDNPAWRSRADHSTKESYT